MLQTITDWMAAHPLIVSQLIWPLVTALLTLAFSWAEKSQVPILGKIVTVLKIVGVDGPRVLAWLKSLTAPKDPPAQNPPAPPGPPSTIRKVIPLSVLALAIGVGGCAWFDSHGATVVPDAAQVAVCILQHSSEPAEQILLDCAAPSLQVVTDVLAAHRDAASREKSGCAK